MNRLGIKEIEAMLSTPEGAQDAKLFARYDEVKKQLKQAENEWEAAMEEVETLNQ